MVCIKIKVEPRLWGALSPLPCAQPNYLNSALNHFSQQNLWVTGPLTLSAEVWWGLSPFLLVTATWQRFLYEKTVMQYREVQLKTQQWQRDTQEIVSTEWYFREIQWSSEPECIRCSLHSQGKTIWSQSMPLIKEDEGHRASFKGKLNNSWECKILSGFKLWRHLVFLNQKQGKQLTPVHCFPSNISSCWQCKRLLIRQVGKAFWMNPTS